MDTDTNFVDIRGPFAIGVENCTDVDDISIDGSATAVSSNSNDADSISGSVLRNCSTRCIDATMTESSDRIDDNIVDPNGGGGIRVVGRSVATGPKVDHNLVQRASVGISLTGTTYLRVENNVLVDCAGACNQIDVGSHVTLTNNVCENDSDCTCKIDSLTAPLGTCLY